MSLKSLYDKADARVRKWAATIGAVIVIVGALTGALSWVQSQFTNVVTEQISDFQAETREADRRHEETITRVELVALMEHDPTNTAAIEKTARYYFRELDGDSYMLQKYSSWAKQYGGDINIIVGVQ